MFLPEIRFCGPRDVPAILEANRLSPRPWPDALVARDLMEPSRDGAPCDGPSYLGAFARTAEARLLGYAVMGYEAHEALLMGLMVLPAYRRRGIGMQLVAAVAECARSLGRTRLILRVGEVNGPARALYEALFFRRKAVRERYYSNGEDAVEMVLVLPRSPETGREGG